MGGLAARTKGKSGEREIIDMLQPVVNEVYVAHCMQPPLLQRNLLQAHQGGCDIHGLDWFSPEIKRHETMSLNQWWEQAERQAGTTRVPVLLYRASRMPWRVRMYGSLCPGCTALVDISMDAFIKWFRLALWQEVDRVAKDEEQE